MAETATNPSDISETQAAIAAALEGVEKRFDHQLRSDLPPVSRLVSHVEHYRGKMLLPTVPPRAAAREGVENRFDHQLRSALPPVSRLVSHVEHYRGKMLRPTLALVCGLAAPSAASGRHTAPSLSPAHITLAAVRSE